MPRDSRAGRAAPAVFAAGALGIFACGEQDRTYLLPLQPAAPSNAPLTPLLPGTPQPEGSLAGGRGGERVPGGQGGAGSTPEAEPPDARAAADAGVDAGLPDTGLPDTGLPEAGLPDTGVQAGCLENATQCLDSVTEATCMAGALVAVPCAADSLCQSSRCGVAQWVAQFGDSSSDGVAALLIDALGNSFVLGNGGAGGFAELDTFLRSYSARGELRWQQRLSVQASALTAAADGLILAGSVGGDVFVRKVDVQGSELWENRFGSPGADVVLSASAAADGNLFLVGQTESVWPGQRRTSANVFEGLLVKASTSGELLWARQIGSQGADAAYTVTTIYAVSAGPDGSAVIAGSGAGSFAGQPSLGGYDALVQKYDRDGKLLWTRQFGSFLDDDAWAVQVDLRGNVLVAGVTSGQLPGQTQRGTRNAFLRKYDSEGSELWTQQLGNGGLDSARALAVDSDGNVLLAGSTLPAAPASGASTPVATSEPPAHGTAAIGDQDGFVSKFSADGERSWTRFIGTTGSDTLRAVGFGRHGSVLVAGSTSGTFPGQRPATGSDAFVVRFAE